MHMSSLRRRMERLEHGAREEMVEIPQQDGTVAPFPASAGVAPCGLSRCGLSLSIKRAGGDPGPSLRRENTAQVCGFLEWSRGDSNP